MPLLREIQAAERFFNEEGSSVVKSPVPKPHWAIKDFGSRTEQLESGVKLPEWYIVSKAPVVFLYVMLYSCAQEPVEHRREAAEPIVDKATSCSHQPCQDPSNSLIAAPCVRRAVQR